MMRKWLASLLTASVILQAALPAAWGQTRTSSIHTVVTNAPSITVLTNSMPSSLPALPAAFSVPDELAPIVPPQATASAELRAARESARAATQPMASVETARETVAKPFEAGTAQSDSPDAVTTKENSSKSSTLDKPSAPKRGFRKWVPSVPKNVRPLLAGAFAWNFLTIGAYSMIGPARGALLMTQFGPNSLPWLYMASAALTGAVVWGYQRFSKVSRRKLIGGSLVMLAATLGLGALAVSAVGSPALSFSYFLWTDVFGIMSVTLFWTYANDVFRHDEAKRYFGWIAAASPVGSLAGAYAVKHYVGAHGPLTILVAASAVFALVLPIFAFMERHSGGRGAEGGPAHGAAPAAATGILKTIAASPYLLFLTVLVACERLVPDFTNYLFSVAAAHAYPGNAARMASFFADVNFWTSAGSFVVSTFLTGLALRMAGIGGSLMTAGLVNLAFFALFPLGPGLVTMATFFALDGVTRYTVFKTAKETTYSATDKDVIYRVKPFVEMFVYRFARGLAGFLLLAAAWLGGGPAAAAWLGLPLAVVWLYSAWRVGRENAKLEAARPKE